MKEKTILIIGSVTPAQYAWIRLEMIRKGLKPVVKRLDVEAYDESMVRIWVEHDKVAYDHLFGEETDGEELEKLHNKAVADEKIYLDGLAGQFGSVYGIVYENDTEREHIYVQLTDRLRTVNPRLQQFAVQPDGRVEFVEGPDLSYDVI